jgi:hypothetical protein
MVRIYLKNLPVDHPLRNKPLVGAFYHAHEKESRGREVYTSYGIAKKTFNELGPAWIDNETFYFNVD